MGVGGSVGVGGTVGVVGLAVGVGLGDTVGLGVNVSGVSDDVPGKVDVIEGVADTVGVVGETSSACGLSFWILHATRAHSPMATSKTVRLWLILRLPCFDMRSACHTAAQASRLAVGHF